MGDEEDDYMSDAVLNQCVDTRPGLVPERISKQYQKESKQKKREEIAKTKPNAVLEAEKREEGLKNAISTDNKGFALLSKMGYKPGMAIGKTGQGRKEPVGIELPQGRSGLGHVAEKRKRQEQVAECRARLLAKRQKTNEQLQKDFRLYHRTKHAEKQNKRDLSKSQRVCAQLDEQQGDTEPSESYFWPPPLPKASEEDEKEEQEEEDEEQDELTASEKLQLLTEYLRSNYFYCVWCGTQYDDTDDMNNHCPGNTAEDHDD